MDWDEDYTEEETQDDDNMTYIGKEYLASIESNPSDAAYMHGISLDTDKVPGIQATRLPDD